MIFETVWCAFSLCFSVDIDARETPWLMIQVNTFKRAAQRNGHVVSLSPQLTPGQDPPQSPPELSQTEENSFSQPAVPTSPSQQGNTEHNTHKHTPSKNTDLTQTGGRFKALLRCALSSMWFQCVNFTSKRWYFYFSNNIITPFKKQVVKCVVVLVYIRLNLNYLRIIPHRPPPFGCHS